MLTTWLDVGCGLRAAEVHSSKTRGNTDFGLHECATFNSTFRVILSHEWVVLVPHYDAEDSRVGCDS